MTRLHTPADLAAALAGYLQLSAASAQGGLDAAPRENAMNTAAAVRVEHRVLEVKGLRTFYRAAGDPTHPVIGLL